MCRVETASAALPVFFLSLGTVVVPDEAPPDRRLELPLLAGMAVLLPVLTVPLIARMEDGRLTLDHAASLPASKSRYDRDPLEASCRRIWVDAEYRACNSVVGGGGKVVVVFVCEVLRVRTGIEEKSWGQVQLEQASCDWFFPSLLGIQVLSAPYDGVGQRSMSLGM